MHDYSLRSGGTRKSKQDRRGGGQISPLPPLDQGCQVPRHISHTETERDPLGFYQRNHQRGAQQENVLKIGRLMP